MNVTIDALAEEGKLQILGYTSGVFTFANFTVTTLAEGEEQGSPDTSDAFFAAMAAVAILSLGVI